MVRFGDDIGLTWVDLSADRSSLLALLEGQREALRQFGLHDVIVTGEEAKVPLETYGVIARTRDGRVVGGLRVHTRRAGEPLPIEADDSAVPARDRARIADVEELAEIRGLFVCAEAPRGLSRALVVFGRAQAQELGYRRVIAMAHWACFEHVAGPLGFSIDPYIAPIAYPDERYRSLVLWHVEPQPRARKVERVVSPAAAAAL